MLGLSCHQIDFRYSCNIWRGSGEEADYNFLAKLFMFNISGLADRFLMEVVENVNPGTGKKQFSKIPSDYLKNMQSQIVVCHSRDLQFWEWLKNLDQWQKPQIWRVL